jgi:hypothetical protein
MVLAFMSRITEVLNMPMVLISMIHLSFLNLKVAELGAKPYKGCVGSTPLVSNSISPSLFDPLFSASPQELHKKVTKQSAVTTIRFFIKVLLTKLVKC